MKFFLDANIPYTSLGAFKELNLESLHARDVGLSRADDKEIFDYSVKNNSVLVTKDLEFANPMLFSVDLYPGIVVMRLPSLFKASQFANALKDFLKSIDIENLKKSIAIVKVGRYRIRKFK